MLFKTNIYYFKIVKRALENICYEQAGARYLIGLQTTALARWGHLNSEPLCHKALHILSGLWFFLNVFVISPLDCKFLEGSGCSTMHSALRRVSTQ